MKQKFVIAHMKVAQIYANLSTANRMKVGCILVKDDRVISIGYNGTPHGWSNQCEDEHGNTYPYVYHAEANAISKVARSAESADGATAFVTCSPCLDCAKLIAQSGIREVFYLNEYRNTDGVEFLRKCNISVTKVNDVQNGF